MKEYNFNEMQEMQAKALARVHDMQMRAKYAADNAQRELIDDKKENSDKYRERFYETVSAMPPKKSHIKMPVELPDNIKPYESFKEYFEPENKRIEEKKTVSAKANLLDDVFKEPDKALLMALLLLLESDKADEELLMSLLYIML